MNQIERQVQSFVRDYMDYFKQISSNFKLNIFTSDDAEAMRDNVGWYQYNEGHIIDINVFNMTCAVNFIEQGIIDIDTFFAFITLCVGREYRHFMQGTCIYDGKEIEGFNKDDAVAAHLMMYIRYFFDAYYLLNNEEAPENLLNLTDLRGAIPLKEAEVDLKICKIKVAVIYGIKELNQIYEHLKNYQFIEIMTCPNGCVGGGGQPILPQQKQAIYIEERGKNLYQHDQKMKKRSSYEKEKIKQVYNEFLEKPPSEKSKKLLHTTYEDKSNIITEKN